MIDALYPVSSSIWTVRTCFLILQYFIEGFLVQDESGFNHESACYVPNAEEAIVATVCPAPFVRPLTDKISRNYIKPVYFL